MSRFKSKVRNERQVREEHQQLFGIEALAED
jgi:hypothetical protein